MRCALAIIVLAAVLAGCGGGKSSTQLAAGERAEAARAEAALTSYCQEVRRYLIGKRGSVSASDFRLVEARLGRLFSLARQKPDARYQSDQTLRDLLGDMAETLEATNCSQTFEQELNRAFNSLPPPAS
jgi:hypothetical protein